MTTFETNPALLPRLVPRTVQENIIEIIKNENHPISLSTLTKHSSDFLQAIIPSHDDIKEIEEATRAQSKSARWYDEHHCRITASNFGTFCKGSVTTCKIKSLLYSGFESKFTSNAILWGKLHEISAFQQYQKLIVKSISIKS